MRDVVLAAEHRRRVARLVAVAASSTVVATALLAAPSSAAPASSGGPVDLAREADLVLAGAVGDGLGESMADAGDVNGDGRPDLIIGATSMIDAGAVVRTAAYVVFGPRPGVDLAAADLTNLGSQGFRIIGPPAAVAGIGDINADGFDDVMVGPRVVLGSAAPTDVVLSELGSRGFALVSAPFHELGSMRAAPAGDVNGDGVDDAVFGVPGAFHIVFGDEQIKDTFGVLFGSATVSDVRLDQPSDRVVPIGLGFDFRTQINIGFTSRDVSVAGLGDFNRDGFDDVAVGQNTTFGSRVFVVFGDRAMPPVTPYSGFSGLAFKINPSQGFTVTGPAFRDTPGASLAGVGDVNGDGYPDLLMGNPQGDPPQREDAGAAYVLLGSRSTDNVNLGQLGSRGYRIDGLIAGDRTGESVAAAGDVNGDGLPDMLIGAPRADFRGVDAGAAYLVFGSCSTGPVDLLTIGPGAIRLDGGVPGGLAGTSVAGVGDLTADGVPDVAVGVPAVTRGSRFPGSPGSVSAVAGFRTAPAATCPQQPVPAALPPRPALTQLPTTSLPGQLRNEGATRIQPTRPVTTAGQRITVRVVGHKVVGPFGNIGGRIPVRTVFRDGSLQVILPGTTATQVTVTLTADAGRGFAAMNEVAVYRTRRVA